MNKTLSLLLKAVGIIMALAFLQWLTFDYPDVNPFWPGAIFAPGMVSQFINWIIVCVIGAVGWGIFSLGKAKGSQDKIEPNK